MAKIIDVSIQNFETAVLMESNERAVVLAFAHSTALSKLSDELGFDLALVDPQAPENRQILAALRVQSLDTVFVFHQGQPVDAFHSTLSEAEIKQRLAPFFMSSEELELQSAEEALAVGQATAALPVLQKWLAKKPEDKKLQFLAAKAQLLIGRKEEAKALLAGFQEGDALYTDAKSLLEMMDFYSASEEATPYGAACKLACEGKNREALEAFLELASESDAATKAKAKAAMLTLFGVLGPKHELTWEYRARLNRVVFV
jgi:putative thioredoxin